jgi:hypothetical protein
MHLETGKWPAAAIDNKEHAISINLYLAKEANKVNLQSSQHF